MPTVTIVTPSFNQGDFIRATIESVLSQNYPHLEYIVMDGGSTDQTATIVSEYAARLTWISEKDRGQAHAINKGFAIAKGDIVAWLNSDDLLLPGAVTRAVNAFAAAPYGIGAVYGEGYLLDRAGRITGRFPATEPFNLWKLAYLSDYILQQSTFFRRAAVAEVGWLDEHLHYTMDWDLLIRLGVRMGLHYVPEYLGALREYPEAKSFSGGRARIEEIRRMLERHTGLRRAPGYWTYGIEALRSSWRERLGRSSSTWLGAPAKLAGLLLMVPMAVPLLMINRHCQGLYADSWVADSLKWMLPETAGEVVLRGRVPEHPALARQVLVVTTDGCELGRWSVGPGDFTLRFAIPLPRKGPVLFEVLASRYIRPRFGSEMSARRMSWMLENIGWVP